MALVESSADPGPFGYILDDMAGPPLNLQPPLPQPDSAILNPRDTNTLHNFFEHFDTSDDLHFPTSNLSIPQGDQDPSLGSLDFGWPPPRFEGSWSQRQGPTPSLNRTQSFTNHIGQSAMSYDSDVTQAAVFLAQGNAANPNVVTPMFHMPNPFDQQELPDPSASRPTSASVHSGIELSNGSVMQRPHGSLSRHSSSYREDGNMVSNSYARNSLGHFDQRPPARVPGMSFGSDPNFHVQGFVVPPGQPTEEAVVNGLMQKVDFSLHPDTSAENTRPSSPVFPLPEQGSRKRSEPNDPIDGGATDSDEDDEVESAAKPTKRPKVKVKEENAAVEDLASPSPKQRKGKAGPKRRRPSAHDIGSKRGKGQPASGKGKPNLTEEQKRQNHIASEQKRRQVIGFGFEELDRLVPELRGANHSKSVKLEIAAKFLTELVEGNKVLRAKVAEAGVT